VWGESRAQAIQRLTRALDEYRVAGVQTTLPFFRWLVRQPEFAAARFSTTYLDTLLATREGPFVTPTPTEAEDALVAAALAAWARAHHNGGDRPAAEASSAWARAARLEGRR
jgi:acetyl/propionyl-CoA carboxylase alpha subunit